MTSGGARPGAGRKVGYRKPDAMTHFIAVRLNDTHLVAARELGEGNVSLGVRRALDAYIEAANEQAH